MVAFIDAHRAAYGVESICAQLPIAPATTVVTSSSNATSHDAVRGIITTRTCCARFGASGRRASAGLRGSRSPLKR